MSNKTKNKKALDQIGDITQTAGLLLMTAAVTLGMVEVPEQHREKAVLTQQPVFAAVENGAHQGNNAVRREKEESGPHYVSYSTFQRTPSRTGKA